MAARASWSGYLKVSLLSVPVKAYSATTSDAGKISLRQLHAGCSQRIRHQSICTEHGPVTSDEIVSGYEAAEGEYVVLSDDELAALDDANDRTVQVEAFVPATHVDPVYYTEKTWYLAPVGPAEQRLYGLLQGGLRSGARHAVGRAVINRRSQPVLLRPMGRLIALTVLRYDALVTRPEAFDEHVADTSGGDEERTVIGELIESMSVADFDLTTYRDEYAERLSRLIESKSGERVSAAEPPARPATVDDRMMELLRRSVSHVADPVPNGRTATEARELSASAPTETHPLKRSG